MILGPDRARAPRTELVLPVSPGWRPNPWVERWQCATDLTRDRIRGRAAETQRFPLVPVVRVEGGIEVYGCGHRAMPKLGPGRKPYAARSRRCVECRVIDLEFAALVRSL